MPYKIDVRPLAVMEILEAYDWYELQNVGLGAEFLDELDKFYDVLLDNPLVFSYYEAPVRDGKIRRFPYTIAYELIGTTIIIYSVYMSKKNPSGKRIR